MQLRSGIILAALALARIAFGYQFQTIATLATDLVWTAAADEAGIANLRSPIRRRRPNPGELPATVRQNRLS